MTPPSAQDRRRPTLPALHQPDHATIRARLGERWIVEDSSVIELTDRTIVLEVADATVALALTVAPTVEVELGVAGGATRTLTAEPGRRASDIPTSRRVELVVRDVDA